MTNQNHHPILPAITAARTTWADTAEAGYLDGEYRITQQMHITAEYFRVEAEEAFDAALLTLRAAYDAAPGSHADKLDTAFGAVYPGIDMDLIDALYGAFEVEHAEACVAEERDERRAA